MKFTVGDKVIVKGVVDYNMSSYPNWLRIKTKSQDYVVVNEHDVERAFVQDTTLYRILSK